MQKKVKKNIEIKDYIGIYDGYILDSECDKAIEFFKKQEALNKAYDRLQSENANTTIKNDKAITLNEDVTAWLDDFKSLLLNFDIALRHYQDSTGVLSAYGINSFKYTNLKIQRTLPTQGYHLWHLEHGHVKDNAYRALVFTIISFLFFYVCYS